MSYRLKSVVFLIFFLFATVWLVNMFLPPSPDLPVVTVLCFYDGFL